MKQGGSHAVGGFTRPSHSTAGFTIVETMIVLAVTAVLATSMLILVSGRQNKTEFQVSINDLQQHLQQIINQTESGYYPHSTNFTCSSGTPPTFTAGGTSGQGANGSCIFLGNVLYFGPSQDPSSFSVFPIAGNRLNGSHKSVTSLAEAWPVAISYGANTDYTSYKMESGLTYKWGISSTASPQPFALGLLSTLGAAADSATPTNNTSGTQQFRLWGFTSWANPTIVPDGVVTSIKAATNVSTTTITEQTAGVSFCIASGSTDQSGLFTISDGLVVTLQIKDGTVC